MKTCPHCGASSEMFSVRESCVYYRHQWNDITKVLEVNTAKTDTTELEVLCDSCGAPQEIDIEWY
jgi:hypothetical protein